MKHPGSHRNHKDETPSHLSEMDEALLRSRLDLLADEVRRLRHANEFLECALASSTSDLARERQVRLHGSSSDESNNRFGQ
jgi:hypothetical protein